MTETKNDLLITGQQAAQLIGVSPPTFYKMSREHENLAPQPAAGNTVVWSLNAVLGWIELQNMAGKQRRDDLVSQWMCRIDEREDVERRR